MSNAYNTAQREVESNKQRYATAANRLHSDAGLLPTACSALRACVLLLLLPPPAPLML